MIGKASAIKAHVPTAEAAIQVLSGTDIKVNESFHLPLLAAFEKFHATFNAWNTSEEMEMGMFRISIPAYDPRAFVKHWSMPFVIATIPCWAVSAWRLRMMA